MCATMVEYLLQVDTRKQSQVRVTMVECPPVGNVYMEEEEGPWIPIIAARTYTRLFDVQLIGSPNHDAAVASAKVPASLLNS